MLELPFDKAWATDSTILEDTSGWEHHGTLHSGADDAANKAAPGQVGAHGLAFDGVDDYVSVGSSAGPSAGSGQALDVSGGRFTQAAWVYLTPKNDGLYPILSSTAYTEATYGHPYLHILGRTQVQAGFGDWRVTPPLYTGHVLTENAWNHVATTFDGTTYKIYVNGVEAAKTDRFSGKRPQSTQRFDVGCGTDVILPTMCATVAQMRLEPLMD